MGINLEGNRVSDPPIPTLATKDNPKNFPIDNPKKEAAIKISYSPQLTSFMSNP